MTTDTPRTDARISTTEIENEDSCCAIYVRIEGRNYDGDLIDADFTRSLEREATAYREELERLLEVVSEEDHAIITAILGQNDKSRHEEKDENE